jgi:hypothetical protein
MRIYTHIQKKNLFNYYNTSNISYYIYKIYIIICIFFLLMYIYFIKTHICINNIYLLINEKKKQIIFSSQKNTFKLSIY